MEGTVIAVFVMMAVGLIVVLAGVYKLMKPDVKIWQVITPFVFGILMLGLSAFGLQFMTTYGEFLSKVLPLIKTPGTETYANAVDAIGTGKLSAENTSTAKSIMLENPVPDLESLIETRIVTAPDAEGKAGLKEMLADLRAKKQMAGQIADNVVEGNRVNNDKLGSLDGSTKQLVAQEITRRAHVIGTFTPMERESIKKVALPKRLPAKP